MKELLMSYYTDKYTGYIEQLEHVSWYENGEVRILDRRIYPIRIEYVSCKRHEEVAQALTNMVTQGGGPSLTVGMGMCLAANEARNLPDDEYLSYMEKAGYTLSHARPTTVFRMVRFVAGLMDCIKQMVAEGRSPDERIEGIKQYSINITKKGKETALKMGQYVADKIPHNGTIMTQCYAGSMIAGVLLACRERGNEVKVICPETRPYLQGARLTASVIKEMGFDVTVISDNMPAYVMGEKHVDLFTSAADVITMDGHMINKVGTFQIALAAQYWGIPYVVTGIPVRDRPTLESVVIEERNEIEVLSHLGTKVTLDGVKAFYPAFDITPPKLCQGVATDKGFYPTYDLWKYYEDNKDLEGKII